ncbi:hypothetical protein [Sinorhizobium medicae]|uniref:hypothetical protein n=1 Tax=Sinorhizobium medicae TaxID=110321 RepID=UPI000FDAF91B|nr:hypothetical protein [Sinorhizobium medicae]RVJ38502.1 hypothetical protein CN180_22215 [Sinorhizobium medicae]
MRLIAFLGVLALVLPSAQNAVGQDRIVRVWMNAFIPDKHPTLPGLVKKTTKGTFVIDAPKVPIMGTGGLFIPSPALIESYMESSKDTCFETDNRDFSAAQDASARVSVALTLNVSTKDMTLSEKTIKIGPSHHVDCKTGAMLSSKKAADSGVTIGNIKKDGWYRTIFVRAASANPYYGFPDIDYSFTLRFDPIHQKMTINGSTGAFPAYEAYWQVGKGPVTLILNRPPQEKATPLALFDLSLGFNTVNFNGSISLLK